MEFIYINLNEISLTNDFFEKHELIFLPPIISPGYKTIKKCTRKCRMFYFKVKYLL